MPGAMTSSPKKKRARKSLSRAKRLVRTRVGKRLMIAGRELALEMDGES